MQKLTWAILKVNFLFVRVYLCVYVEMSLQCIICFDDYVFYISFLQNNIILEHQFFTSEIIYHLFTGATIGGIGGYITPSREEV